MFVKWTGVGVCKNATDGYSSENNYNTTVHYTAPSLLLREEQECERKKGGKER